MGCNCGKSGLVTAPVDRGTVGTVAAAALVGVILGSRAGRASLDP
jgi:hypothetical protein